MADGLRRVVVARGVVDRVTGGAVMGGVVTGDLVTGGAVIGGVLTGGLVTGDDFGGGVLKGGAGWQLAARNTLVSSVTAALRASARPWTVVPV